MLDASQVFEAKSSEWRERENDDAYETGKYVRSTGRPYRFSAHEALLRSDFMVAIGVSDGAPAHGIEPIARPGKGRKRASGGDKFWVEACRLLHSGECAPGRHKRSEFISRMQAWSEAHGGVYRPSTVEDKIKAMWAVIDKR